MSVITLSGPNEYELQQAKSGLIREHKQKFGELSLHRFEMGESAFEDIAEAVLAVPFLSAGQLVLVSGVADAKQHHEDLIELIEKTPSTTTLVIVEPKLDKRTSLYKFLSSETDFQSFGKPDESGLVDWVVKRADEAGTKISKSDARHLVRRVGEEQWSLAGELDKLLALDDEITKSLIDEITVEHPRETIFQLLDAIAAQRGEEALKIYAALRKADTEPHYILSMIIWQMQNMTVVHAAGDRTDQQIARDFKMSPYVVGKTRSAVRGMDKRQLMNMQKTLIDVDHQLKSSPLNSELAVEQLIVKLSS